MKTRKHEITLSVQNEKINFNAYTVGCAENEIEIVRLNIASNLNSTLNVSTILINENLMGSAMSQLKQHYLADALQMELSQ